MHIALPFTFTNGNKYSDKVAKFATALDVAISNFSRYFLFWPNSSALA